MTLQVSAVTDTGYSYYQLRELAYCAYDPFYFLETYGKIVTFDQGLTNLSLYPGQKRFFQKLDEPIVVATNSRQTGSTTVMAAHMFKRIVFDRDLSIGVMAHKQNSAAFILQKLKFMFESLPHWMRPGVKTWNKHQVELDNGNKILASVCHSSEWRGLHCDAFYVDHAGYIDQEAFRELLYPNIEVKFVTSGIVPDQNRKEFNKTVDTLHERGSVAVTTMHWWEVPNQDDKWSQEREKQLGDELFHREYF